MSSDYATLRAKLEATPGHEERAEAARNRLARETAAEAINTADGPARIDGAVAVEAIEAAGLTVVRVDWNSAEAAIRDLHRLSSDDAFCDECAYAYPCRTIRALDAVAPPLSALGDKAGAQPVMSPAEAADYIETQLDNGVPPFAKDPGGPLDIVLRAARSAVPVASPGGADLYAIRARWWSLLGDENTSQTAHDVAVLLREIDRLATPASPPSTLFATCPECHADVEVLDSISTLAPVLDDHRWLGVLCSGSGTTVGRPEDASPPAETEAKAAAYLHRGSCVRERCAEDCPKRGTRDEHGRLPDDPLVGSPLPGPTEERADPHGAPMPPLWWDGCEVYGRCGDDYEVVFASMNGQWYPQGAAPLATLPEGAALLVPAGGGGLDLAELDEAIGKVRISEPGDVAAISALRAARDRLAELTDGEATHA